MAGLVLQFHSSVDRLCCHLLARATSVLPLPHPGLGHLSSTCILGQEALTTPNVTLQLEKEARDGLCAHCILGWGQSYSSWAFMSHILGPRTSRLGGQQWSRSYRRYVLSSASEARLDLRGPPR